PHLRRGGRRARRVDPGPGAEPLHPAARGARPYVPVHQPRPRRDPPRLRSRGRHVPGPRRGKRADRRDLRRAQPSLYPGARRRSAAPGRAPPRLRPHPRGDPLAALPAARLPFPSALPARLRALPGGSPAPRRDRPGPTFRLPPQRPEPSMSPFRILRPKGSHVPLVLDSPHSGNRYPDDFGAAVTQEQLRASEDGFVDELYSAGPDLGATLIAAEFPRSYIDPNRSLLDIDASLLEAPWPGPAIPSRKTQLGVGLIWRMLDSGEPIYSRKLSVDEVKRRIVEYHQ